MVSNIDTAKRALVALLKSLAGIYSLVVGLTRESADAEVRAAYKQVARKAHPDKGGAPEHQKALNAARDTWEDALRAGKGRGGDHMPKASAAKSATAPVNVSGKPITLVLPTLVLHKRDSIIGPIIASSQQDPVQAARQGSPPHSQSPECCQGQVSQLQEGLQGGCSQEGRHVQAVSGVDKKLLCHAIGRDVSEPAVAVNSLQLHVSGLPPQKQKCRVTSAHAHMFFLAPMGLQFI